MGFSAGAGHIMTIYPNRVIINFSGLTVYDEVTVNGDFEIFQGIMKIDYGGIPIAPTATFGDPSNGFYYSNTNTVSFTSDNIETLRMIYNLVECFTHFKAQTLTATGSIAGDNIICIQ